MERGGLLFAKLERLILSSEMEVLRGPLLAGLFVAVIVQFWECAGCAGLFPKTLQTWGETLSRGSAAVALSYSATGLAFHVLSVSLIASAFAIITLVWSRFQGKDRRFLRWWGWVALILALFSGLQPKVVA